MSRTSSNATRFLRLVRRSKFFLLRKGVLAKTTRQSALVARTMGTVRFEVVKQFMAIARI
jgi:hypothetical protein